jgi:methyltransferase (TIGR00027 family)
MQPGQPSYTALGAAAHRAAHQVLEHGFIFRDPLALRILGKDASTHIERARNDPSARSLRIFIAARSRYAEDALQTAIVSGVRQLVVLGAGLDTYAYRSDPRLGLRIFEVDHPATQEWKRTLLAEAGIAAPTSLIFTPVDFEHESLAQGLLAAGFHPAQPSFFTWLGVVPYLTEHAAFATLGFIAALPGHAHVVFDYINPPESRSDAARAAHEELATRVSRLREELRTYWEAEPLSARLRSLGYRQIEDLGPAGIVHRFLPGRAHRSPDDPGGHIVHASTLARSE